MRSNTMQLQRIPRTIVCTWLRAARVPLDAVEAILRRGEHDVEWHPALAFASFEATVKQVAGSLLDDDELTEEGQVGQARVAQLRKAEELGAVAAQRKQQADAEFLERRRNDEEQKLEAAREADEREAALERERTAKTRRLAEEDARKRQQVTEAQATEEKVADRQDRSARTTRIAAEREALGEERKAV